MLLYIVLGSVSGMSGDCCQIPAPEPKTARFLALGLK